MDVTERRTGLFQHLDGVLGRAEKKAKNPKTKNGEKLSWELRIIQAVNAYGRLLDQEELEDRITKLEEKLKNGVLIPNGK